MAATARKPSRRIAFGYAEEAAAPPAAQPAWLALLRGEARALIAEGLPSPRVEEWKYTNLRALAERGRLQDIPGIGSSTARVVEQALAGDMPEYLARLEAEAAPDSGPGAAIRAALAGDLHLHSDWSDGGATIESMARKAAELGHRYMALTDHSPQLKVAKGLTRDRLLELLVRARPRVAVRAPADELRRVAEPRPLHVVVPDLDDELRAEGGERQVLAGAPPAELRVPRRPRAERLLGPRPGMIVERRHERL